MAKILICEPVAETRELLERLVRRMGHVIVGIDALESVDVLVFEPNSPAGLAIARRVLEARPDASLLACSAEPVRSPLPASPRIVASLQQPFSPADLARALLACTARQRSGGSPAAGA